MTNLSRLVRKKALGFLDGVIANALVGGDAVPARPLGRSRSLRSVVAGRTVLVTGASSGIGLAVARKAARSGARTVLVARSAEKLEELRAEIEQTGGRAEVYTADLSREDSVEALVQQLAADGVNVDVLVNNAGRSIRRSVDHSLERMHDYRRTMALNYFGSVRLILGLLPGMQRQGSGHVVNVSSAGVLMGTPLFSAYVASKAALDAFTRIAATELADAGVRFTTVHMPLVRTPMIAPTEEYRNVRALDAEQAADLVLRALETEEPHLGTRWASLVSAGHALAPKTVAWMIAAGHRLIENDAPSATSPEFAKTG